MTFYSRKDLWLSITIWISILICIATSILPLLDGELGLIGGSIFLVVMLGSAGFIFWLWSATYYVIRDDRLLVRSGPIKKDILLSTITNVKPVVSIISSAALSVHRLEIRFNKYDTIYISPQRQEEFLDILKKHCPTARFEYGK